MTFHVLITGVVVLVVLLLLAAGTEGYRLRRSRRAEPEPLDFRDWLDEWDEVWR